MKVARSLALMAVLAWLPSARAAAPEPVEDEPDNPFGGFNYFIGAGVGVPTFEPAQLFNPGLGLMVGIGYHLTRRLTLQADYAYTSYRLESDLLPDTEAVLTGGQRMHWTTLVARFELLRPQRALNLTLVGGPGLYWRRISIEQVTGVQLVTFCSPGSFACYPSPTPVTDVLGERSSFDFGLSAGLNLSVSLGYPVRIFLEPRFHFILGPLVETDSGPRRANGYYVPIVLGFQYF